MIKKLICMCLLMVMGAMVLGCGEDPILKHFDLSDPKIYWEGTTVEDLQSGGTYNLPASDDVVNISLRKTSTYPELKIEDFKMKNAESIEYILVKPSPTNLDEDYIESFRQYAVIYLKETGHEKVLEAIRHLEGLEIIKSAWPAFPI